mmetsp:Transcript_5385/g.13594  ORF Transcript_5385/g.13594 Transcript_5385/m.13594 type:complete len:224 (+) Transcript_5385:1737-2408(+)
MLSSTTPLLEGSNSSSFTSDATTQAAASRLCPAEEVGPGGLEDVFAFTEPVAVCLCWPVWCCNALFSPGTAGEPPPPLKRAFSQASSDPSEDSELRRPSTRAAVISSSATDAFSSSSSSSSSKPEEAPSSDGEISASSNADACCSSWCKFIPSSIMMSLSSLPATAAPLSESHSDSSSSSSAASSSKSLPRSMSPSCTDKRDTSTSSESPLGAPPSSTSSPSN